MKKAVNFIILSFLTFVLASCDNGVDTNSLNMTADLSLNNINKDYLSTTAANLMTEAIKQEMDVDVVFYPASNLKDKEVDFQLKLGESDPNKRFSGINKDDIKALYNTSGDHDIIATSYMSGEKIKEFIKARTLKHCLVDVHTSGIDYDIKVKGGVVQNYLIQYNGNDLVDNNMYKVAFIYYEYDYLGTFPGYYYGNEFNYLTVKKTTKKATDLLIDYLEHVKKLPNITLVHSKISDDSKDLTNKVIPIYDIQGYKHYSDFVGFKLKTRGVITAYSEDSYNNVYGFYMQDKFGDQKDITSDAIYVELDGTSYSKYSSDIKVGNYVEVTGEVVESYTGTELTRTTLTNITDIDLREINANLPDPVIIGADSDRKIPNTSISTYVGNLNNSSSINLKDGIGFWESLEGMYIKISDPIVTGAKGGKTDANDSDSYLNLFVRADETSNDYQITPSKGLVIDVKNNDYNPEIIELINHSFYGKDGKQEGNQSNFVNSVFNVGDKIGDVEGILTYNVNTFGDGEYALLPTSNVKSVSTKIPLDQRPETDLAGNEDHLTVATFNVENMYKGHKKIPYIAEIIAKNMKSPDILVLTEIQDNDGPDEYGGSGSSVVAADGTLTELINNIEDKGGATDYKYINIDPIAYQEGGETGGNIRVAAIYRSSRVTFNRRGNAGPLDHVGLDNNGDLKLNPGRVYPDTAIFKDTRRSLAMEFGFKDQKIIIIGNHLNSKGSDTPLWGANQPVTLSTEAKRSELAKIINGFSKEILNKNSKAKIILIGDFNEFYAANPMQLIKGKEFINLIETLPFNKRYTYNYGGNSQAIDHVFITSELQKHSPQIEILPVNSDYMYQYSDHNPVISRFEF